MLGDLIGEGQKQQMPFHQESSSALVPAVFSGPDSDASALVLGNAVEAIFALSAASQNPGGMQLPGSATAVEFAAFAAEQIKRALDHNFRALEAAKSFSHGGIGTPKLLAEFGNIAAHTVSLICLPIQTARKKTEQTQEIHENDATRSKINVS